MDSSLLSVVVIVVVVVVVAAALCQSLAVYVFLRVLVRRGDYIVYSLQWWIISVSLLNMSLARH